MDQILAEVITQDDDVVTLTADDTEPNVLLLCVTENTGEDIYARLSPTNVDELIGGLTKWKESRERLG